MHFYFYGGEAKLREVGGGEEGVDREYNLSTAVREVGFSQQAVGMIPGVAQCGEGDHRDDIPTLSHRLLKPAATSWWTVKSLPCTHRSLIP